MRLPLLFWRHKMPGSISDLALLRSHSQRNTLLKQLGWAAVFLAPNFILVMLFTFIPAAGGLALSTAEWDVFSEPKFVGAENYVDLVDDDDFWIALRNTIVYTFTTVPVSIVLFASSGNRAQPKAARHTLFPHYFLYSRDHVRGAGQPHLAVVV